jgi:hypothetical protein
MKPIWKARRSMVKTEAWETCQLLGIMANIGTCSEVVEVSRDSWVVAMGEVWNRACRSQMR